MPLTLDLSEDHLCYDNHELIRYQRIRRVGAGTGADEDVILNAKRMRLTKRQLAESQGAYVAADRNWLFWEQENIADFDPTPWDRVIDGDGVEWTVLSVDHAKFQNTWRLPCRNLKIVHNLRDLITLERCAPGKDGVAAPVRESWTAVYTDLAARVQPEDQIVAVENDVLGGVRHYWVFLSRQVPIANLADWRIRWNDVADGMRPVILEPESYHFTEQVGELPRFRARKAA